MEQKSILVGMVNEEAEEQLKGTLDDHQRDEFFYYQNFNMTQQTPQSN